MSTKNDPAFPLTEDAVNHRNKDFAMQGLTKLEWFAGMALQGMLAFDGSGDHRCEVDAQYAFDLAEAMIAESEKRRDK